MTVRQQKTVKTLLEAMPYIRRFWGTTLVVKYGGAAMTSPRLQEEFAEDMVLLRLVGMKPVVVHGGGPEITRHMGRLGMETRFVDGHRVTDEATMEVARMVLVGKVNKDIVGLINRHRGAAVGLSGEDGRLLRVAPRQHVDAEGNDVDLGRVGDIVSVNVDVLDLLAEQNIPVVASVGADERGQGLQRQRRHRGRRAGRRPQGREDRLPHRRRGHLRGSGRRPGADLGVRPELPRGAAGVRPHRRRHGPQGRGRAPRPRGRRHSAHIIDGRVEHAVLLEILTDAGCGTKVTA